ncbi:MAG: hypothetical protein ACFE8G_07670, partial [Candidatus Hermodarchaeota archaeon]
METLQTLQKLEIETNKLFYDKKTEVLSVYLPDFVFIGNYKKSVRIGTILDDIYKSLGEVKLTRQNISIVDFVTLQPISERMKLKKLKLISKKQRELKEEKKELVADKRDRAPKKEVKDERFKSQKARRSMPAPKPAAKAKKKEKAYDIEDGDYGEFADDEMVLSRDEKYDEFRLMEEAEEELAPPEPSRAPAAPPPPPGAGAPAKTITDESVFIEKERVVGSPPREEPKVEEPKARVYEINMGLQYYSVMMEQTSYLFYVYFSHKELKIV